MITIASINLNKRFFNLKARSKLEEWLKKNNASFLLMQESWLRQNNRPDLFSNYCPLGGNQKVFSWVNTQYKKLNTETESFYQRIEVEYLVVYNVYLDAYKQLTRANQLKQLTKQLLGELNKPILITGDFNIAPTPGDGLINNEPSKFNSKIDRQPLTDLIKACSVIDLGDKEKPEL